MSIDLTTWTHLEKLTWEHVLLALTVLVAARFVSFLLRGLLRRIAESASPHLRLSILRAMPIVRLLIGVAALIVVVPIFVEPTFRNAVAVGVRAQLAQIAETSSYRKSDTPISVIVMEKPWGTKYRLKAYVKESRDQFLFITDLTVRGKEALRVMGIRFAQAPYAAAEPG